MGHQVLVDRGCLPTYLRHHNPEAHCLNIHSSDNTPSRTSYWCWDLFLRQNVYSGSHLKILAARRVTWSTFHSEDPQILGVTEQTLVARATWRHGYIYPCPVMSFRRFQPLNQAYIFRSTNLTTRYTYCQEFSLRVPLPSHPEWCGTLTDRQLCLNGVDIKWEYFKVNWEQTHEISQISKETFLLTYTNVRIISYLKSFLNNV
jgi:hypothetical protein